ncbi:unnamed protein product [Brachionus calyciflorus]|uniref:Uncharacterized protein n=1 Tax=Brachionus calyciflorus TaxID=104777 RepID=A0A813UAR9_9BILA|nr:unnamed protein product [Brachionus calyciflorus]
MNVVFENEQPTSSTNIIDNERTDEIQSICETIVPSVQEENSNLDENFDSDNLIQSSEKTVLNISREYASHNDCIEQIPIVSNNISLSHEKIQELIEGFKEREQKRSSLFKKFSDFSTVSEELCFKTTGFTKQELSFIFHNLKSLILSENR